MRSLSFGEIMMIVLVLLLLVGGGKIAQLGKAFGASVREFKKGQSGE